MSSIKIILRKEEKADGTCPLAIRITKDRKSSYVYLDYSIEPRHWDKSSQRVKKSHPNSTRLNSFLIKKLAEANDKALALETQKAYVSSNAVSQKIKPTGGDTFFARAKLYLDTLHKTGKYNRYTADKPRIKRFREFLRGQDVAFSDITQPLLEKFKIYLKTTKNKYGRHIKEVTINNHLSVIQLIISHAIRDEVIDANLYPFGRGKMKIKKPKTTKIGLTAEEVKRLEEVELSDTYQNHCRNLWLFSFYFAGMRAADVLSVKWSYFMDDRFYYTMNKNDKSDSLKVSDKVLRILAQYEQFKNNKDDLVFPELKRLDNLDDKFILQRTTAFCVSAIDKCLRKHVSPAAEIVKKLTMHIARHTFGNLAGDKIPIQMLQKLYRHSSITTTIGYQANFIHKEADDALNAVISF